MEMQAEMRREPHTGQLISINRKDSCRLLEVYVKRSLSLTEDAQAPTDPGGPVQRKNKWVTVRRLRRHSSDPALHHSCSDKDKDEDCDLGASLAPPPPPPCAAPSPLETVVSFRSYDEDAERKERKVMEVKPEVLTTKKKRKSTLWKNFLGLFSKKWEEEEEEEAEVIPRGGAAKAAAAGGVFPSHRGEQSDMSATGLPLAPDMGSQKKFKKRRSPKRRRSLRKSFRRSSRKDITPVEALGSVQLTDSYFEKVSEEMELIVHQVKDKENEKVLTDEEVINRIIALTIVEGDAIDEKMRENPTLSNFFKGMSYAAFQKLADTYLEEETMPVQKQAPPSLLQAAANPAPELVKLAFTLDFTARVAGLSRQNAGHITGLGNRYLADRFEYTQACTDHPWSDCDD